MVAKSTSPMTSLAAMVLRRRGRGVFCSTVLCLSTLMTLLVLGRIQHSAAHQAPQYNQQMPQNVQFQQQPGQQQHVPQQQQFQQPNAQFQQQNAPQQQQMNQQPVQQQHGHNHNMPSDPKQAARHFKEHAQDKEHAKEHMEGVVDKDPSKMTEAELQMFYFNQHDLDKNNKLDGLELVHAMTHFNPPGVNEPARSIPEDELKPMIDAILNSDDINKDGYIEYAEFANSRMT